ncbi:sigma-54-dependent transcriptional regulator [Spirochaeta lutea]|uniref:Chemotaxis protein CheY n=1 Tax=Spirochaeta lutea TaxID=1480694 RepID=A0A098QXM3_9SPIO|nr:sigma-54 dependent transcriptional regulator [Spirochaeta lutea]KGE72429.1 hypothetical protein DC28_07150 [Spirochaeta lutea]
MDEKPQILIIEDEYVPATLYKTVIEEGGLGTALICTDSRQALAMMENKPIALVLLDLIMPFVGGQELLEKITVQYPHIPVIILTGEEKLETAVECMKRGAFDFMTKPVDSTRLNMAIRHALTIRELQREVSKLSRLAEDQDLEHPEAFAGIVTRSAKMFRIFSYLEAVADSPKPILLTGESGTGKELLAQAIHRLARPDEPFVAVNVSGIEDMVFSDSLFGHRRGSFTGADRPRKGFIEEAGKGTLFLDEIGDLGQSSQIKLLRLLQEGEYYPLGSDTPRMSQARIVAATNASLSELVRQGNFRRDLYYRLIAHQVILPPLRERREDVAELAYHFLKQADREFRRGIRFRIPDDLLKAMTEYDFPGNVRELQGMMYNAVGASQGEELQVQVIRDYLSAAGMDARLDTVVSPSEDGGAFESSPNKAVHGPEGLVLTGTGVPTMAAVEDFLYDRALALCEGNQSKAASMLGVSQSTLSRWLRRNQS